MVTGAGSGIGRATARSLLREGYSVVLCGRIADRVPGLGMTRSDDPLLGLRTVTPPSPEPVKVVPLQTTGRF